SLEEVEQYIKTNKHLPGIPSEKEVAENGVSLGEMQAKLLQKIEELTLYMIELKKENDLLQKRVSSLEKQQQ
ncbi:MAG: TMF family protein, partial [bacterium]